MLLLPLPSVMVRAAKKEFQAESKSPERGDRDVTVSKHVSDGKDTFDRSDGYADSKLVGGAAVVRDRDSGGKADFVGDYK